jgi:hypothetical protein
VFQDESGGWPTSPLTQCACSDYAPHGAEAAWLRRTPGPDNATLTGAHWGQPALPPAPPPLGDGGAGVGERSRRGRCGPAHPREGCPSLRHPRHLSVCLRVKVHVCALVVLSVCPWVGASACVFAFSNCSIFMY